MNRFAKIYLVAVAFTAACTGLSLGFAAVAGKQNPDLAKNFAIQFLGKHGNTETMPSDEAFDIDEGFDKVDISSIAGDIEIVAVEDGSKPNLRFSGVIPKDDEKPYGFKVEGRTLKVEVKKTTWWRLVINDEEISNDDEGLKTTLELPKSWKGSMELSTVNNVIRIGFFNLDALRVNTVNGAVDTDWRLGAKRIKANAVNGDLKLFGNFRDVSAESVNGEIRLGLPKNGKWSFDVKTVSGDIQNNLKSEKGKTGRVEIKTVSGDVTIASMDDQGEEMDE